MTLREYLYKHLGTLDERLDKMTDQERKVFNTTARIRAAQQIADNHRASGRNCHKLEGQLNGD